MDGLERPRPHRPVTSHYARLGSTGATSRYKAGTGYSCIGMGWLFAGTLKGVPRLARFLSTSGANRGHAQHTLRPERVRQYVVLDEAVLHAGYPCGLQEAQGVTRGRQLVRFGGEEDALAAHQLQWIVGDGDHASASGRRSDRHLQLAGACQADAAEFREG